MTPGTLPAHTSFHMHHDWQGRTTSFYAGSLGIRRGFYFFAALAHTALA